MSNNAPKREILADYARLFRIQGIMLLEIFLILGALSVGEQNLRNLMYLFTIGIFQYIYLFVSNDVIDIKVDKLSKELSVRPLVKGTISKNTGIFISAFCFVSVYILTFLVFFRNTMTFYLGITCLTLAAVLGTIYNIYGKKKLFLVSFPGIAQGLDVLFAAYMVTNSIHLSIFTWIISILAFSQMLFDTTVIGGLKDADHDWKMNVKNIVTKTGVFVNENDKSIVIPWNFIFFGMGLRIFSIFIVFVPMIFYGFSYKTWQIALMLIFSIAVLYSAAKMFKIKFFDRDTLRKNIVLQIFFLASLIPMILFPILDTSCVILLIVLTPIWYITGMKIIRFLYNGRPYYN